MEHLGGNDRHKNEQENLLTRTLLVIDTPLHQFLQQENLEELVPCIQIVIASQSSRSEFVEDRLPHERATSLAISLQELISRLESAKSRESIVYAPKRTGLFQPSIVFGSSEDGPFAAIVKMDGTVIFAPVDFDNNHPNFGFGFFLKNKRVGFGFTRRKIDELEMGFVEFGKVNDLYVPKIVNMQNVSMARGLQPEIDLGYIERQIGSSLRQLRSQG